jgi:lipoprotein signal peptidase
MVSKYVQFILIVLVCVGLDQWTKQIASDNLATTHGSFVHPITLEVSEEDAGETVEEFLTGEFEANTPEEIEEIARRFVTDADERRLAPQKKLDAGDTVRVVYRTVSVIPGHWEWEYTRNPGAAFGLLSDVDSPWRIPFFIGVSLLAVIVIVLMLRGLNRNEQLMIWALSLIAGGAIGNFIDRILYGWVIDFIVWQYDDHYRWPTFNVADAFISVGVGILVLDMIIDAFGRDEKEGASDEEE